MEMGDGCFLKLGVAPFPSYPSPVNNQDKESILRICLKLVISVYCAGCQMSNSLYMVSYTLQIREKYIVCYEILQHSMTAGYWTLASKPDRKKDSSNPKKAVCFICNGRSIDISSMSVSALVSQKMYKKLKRTGVNQLV